MNSKQHNPFYFNSAFAAPFESTTDMGGDQMYSKGVDASISLTTGKQQLAKEEEWLRHVFGPDTAAVLFDYGDPRLTPAMRHARFGPPTAKIPLIECGPNSKGLCALIIENENVRDEFLKANPGLAGTLDYNIAFLH